MRQEDLLVEVRDKTLTRVGAIPADLLTMDAEHVHNNVGTWKLQINAEHPLAAVLSTPGAGIIVTGPSDVLFSGPVTKTENAVTATDPLGTLTVEGVDDTIVLGDMLAWPEPTNGDAATQARAYDDRTDTPESLMHYYVDANCGPSAPANRRRAGLIMGTNGKRGKIVSKAARFQQLGELCKELAEPAGLGFRVVQRGANLVFETYAVADRTKEARLGVVNNTLAGQRVSVSTPAKTRVIVGGDGDGSNRLFVPVDNADSIAAETDWGRRIETFIDERSSTDTAELTQKGTESLADGGTTIRAAQAVPMEDSALDFGRDWFLGDKVSVIVGGSEMAAVVTGMVLKVDSDGYRLGAILGDPTPMSPEAAAASAQKELESRVSSLERTAEATPPGPRVIQPTGITQATPPSGYPQNETTEFILSASAATQGGWDFGGKWGIVTTRLWDGEGTQMWRRTHQNTTHHETWMRGGNSSGWSAWRQVAWDHQLTAGAVTQESPVADYREGVSTCYLDNTQSTAGGWSFGGMWGHLITRRIGVNASQMWHRVGGVGTVADLWLRQGNSSGWSDWQQVGFDAHLSASAGYTQDSPPAVYPVGVSTMTMTESQAAAGGWAFGTGGKYGTLRTVRPRGTSYAHQTWLRLSPTTVEEWTRTGNDASGWTAWRTSAFNEKTAKGVVAMQTLASMGDTAYVGNSETLVYSQTFTAEANRCYKVVLRIGSVDTDGKGDSTTLRYAKQTATTLCRWTSGTTASLSGTAIGSMYTTVFDDDSNTASGLDATFYLNNPPAGSVAVGISLFARRDAATYGYVRYLTSTLSTLVVEDAGPAL